jgi:hypothetical protein
VPPFPVSDTAQPPTTMASQSAQLAATLANQAIPTPGTTPASTPSKGAISKKTTVTTTSTTAAKTTPTKTRKKKTKTAPAQEQTVSISRKRLTEILKLPEQIKSLQLRVTNAERALKRKTSTSNSDDFAKKPKVGSKSLIAFLRDTPRLVNPAYFHNWWNKKGVFTLSKRRMIGELTNMGLSQYTLVIRSLHFLAEVYCLVISLLLESGAIQSLPSDVPNCYGNSGLTKSLKLEKLALIVPNVEQQISSDPEFLNVDRRRAGAVAASILAAKAASQPPVSSRSDLRERLARRTRKPVVSQRVTFGPPRQREERAFSSRIFTNSNRSGRVLDRDRAGIIPARGLIAKNSSESRTTSAQNETNPEVVPVRVDVAMKEDDSNPEELATGFFHATETFPEEDNAAAPDQQILAGVSLTKRLPGNNTQPGSSGASRRRSRSPSPGLSRSGSRHSSMRREVRHSRSRKRDSGSSKRRDYSREAEDRIPGFTSEANRKKTSGSTTIRDRRFSPDRRSYSSFPCTIRSRRSASCNRRKPRRDSRDRREDRRRYSRERADGQDHRGHHRSSSRHRQRTCPPQGQGDHHHFLFVFSPPFSPKSSPIFDSSLSHNKILNCDLFSTFHLKKKSNNYI